MAIPRELQSRGGEDRVWSHSDWEETKAKARYKKERDGRKNHTFLGSLLPELARVALVLHHRLGRRNPSSQGIPKNKNCI
jgi:hypothetical protein